LATPLDLAFTPGVLVATMLITGISAYFVRKQQAVSYQHVRSLLIGVHVLYIFVVFLELVRTFYQAPFYMNVYTEVWTSLVLGSVLLLTLVALAVYTKPSEPRFISLFHEIFMRKLQLALFALYTGFIIAAIIYLWIQTPFVISQPDQITNIAGVPVLATLFDPFYLNILLVVLLVFSVYPAGLLVLANRANEEPDVKRALRILPLAWAAIGLDLLVFNGYLLTVNIDASSAGYLFAAVGFSTTAAVFRRATILSGFFQPIPLSNKPSPANPFSSKMGKSLEALAGRNFLLEVDPASNYDQAVRDFALEFISNNYLVFAFTSKGRPVYNSLSQIEGVRFYTFSTKVSYPRPTGQTYEVLVPQNDQSVILNVLDKTMSANPDVKIAIVFDSITDLLLSSGFDNAYKFLKQANELISEAGETALFLLTKGAHDEKLTNVIRSLFPNQLTYEGNELKVARAD
jgi:hypothetical protein